MKLCNGQRKCSFLGLVGDCLKKSKCEHQLIQLYERDDQNQPSDLTRIADALEKIAKELVKMNKLKVFENYDVEPSKIREIMEG